MKNPKMFLIIDDVRVELEHSIIYEAGELDLITIHEVLAYIRYSGYIHGRGNSLEEAIHDIINNIESTPSWRECNLRTRYE